MRVRRTSCPILLTCGGLMVLVSVPAMLIWQVEQQEKLNQSLLVAVQHDDVERVARLLDKGADANAQDGLSPPPFLALVNSLLKKLHSRNALHKEPRAGQTAIQWACRPFPMPHPDAKYVQWDAKFRIVELLAQRGANVNVPTDNDSTYSLFPLYAAEEYLQAPFKYEVMACLIRHGANVNAKTEFGFTPLMEAVADEDMQAAKILLEQGADLNWKNADGQSALSLTKHHHRRGPVTIDIPLRTFLLQKGAEE